MSDEFEGALEDRGTVTYGRNDEGLRILALREPTTVTTYAPMSADEMTLRAWAVDRLLASHDFRFSLSDRQGDNSGPYIDAILENAEKIKDYLQEGPQDDG
jgi:hypothetical protein